MIQSYNYDVTRDLKYLGKPRGEIYYGVEWEVETIKGDKDEISDEIEALFPHFLKIKRDGSLHDGFEVVTAPASLKIHQLRWREMFNPSNTFLESLKDKPNCGIHIHFSKAPFTLSQIGVIHHFINFKKYRDFHIHLAGRESTAFAGYLEAPIGKDDLSILPIKEVEYSPTTLNYKLWRKYTALNISKPNTCEVRIFASTTSLSTFLTRLEYVASLTQWVKKNPSLTCSTATWERWREYVNSNSSLYPSLFKWLGDYYAQ